MPRGVERHQGLGAAPGHVEPDRLARRGQGRVRQGQPQGLADDLGRGRRAQEMAAAARPSAHARQPSSAASSRLSSPRAKRAPIDWILRRVLALGRRQHHAAGHEHAGQVAAGWPGPSSWPAGPCRRWPRPARPAPWGSSGPGGGRSTPRRCDRPGCRTCRACPGCGRRTGRSNGRHRARRPARLNSSAAARRARPSSQWPV